jgi:hypothetical protein
MNFSSLGLIWFRPNINRNLRLREHINVIPILDDCNRLCAIRDATGIHFIMGNTPHARNRIQCAGVGQESDSDPRLRLTLSMSRRAAWADSPIQRFSIRPIYFLIDFSYTGMAMKGERNEHNRTHYPLVLAGANPVQPLDGAW